MNPGDESIALERIEGLAHAVEVTNKHTASPRPVTDAVNRARLVSRIEIEARAYRNADSTTKQIRWGRVLGLLEAGAVLGYWPRRKAGGVSEAMRNGLPAWRLRRMLARL